MPNKADSALAPLSARILTPIHSILKRVLPDFAKKVLSDPAIRAEIIDAVDLTLMTEYPAARAIPEALRHRLIGSVLNLVVGETADETAARAAAKNPLKAFNLSADELALLETSAPGNSVRGFLMDAEADDEKAVIAAAKKVLGTAWSVVKLYKETYRATSAEEILSVPEAWSLSHELEETLAIAQAEPEIEWVPAPASIGGQVPDVRGELRRSAGVKSHLECSVPKTWHLDLINAPKAWAIISKAKKPEKGKGVTIGHLDTGITYHAELPIDAAHIDLAKGKNMYDPQNPKVGNKPLDPMIEGLGMNPGHGTATVSIITGHAALTGSAANATVVPYRISPTVVHFDVTRIAEGIRQAHQDGCDVITMSMGGPPSRTNYLNNIIQMAVDDGMIICTAAGNQIGSNDLTPMVVWPAAMDQVIAVAGCNCQDQVWSGSSRGPEVNITAAAQDVWNASAQTGALSPTPNPAKGVGQGNGTSFATPTVAGMAACWLARHGGREALGKFYGHKRYVPLAFAQLLRTTAFRTPDGWKKKLMGPGILDAEKLMNAPLPSKADLTGWPKKKHPWFGNLIGGIFKGVVSRRASRGIGPRGSKPEVLAERFKGELAYHLFDRPAIQEMAQNSPEIRPVSRGIRRRSAVTEDPNALEDATILLRGAASKQLAEALHLH